MDAHPYALFLAFFFGTLTLGAWLGYKLSRWRIRRLSARIELLKLELFMLRR